MVDALEMGDPGRMGDDFRFGPIGTGLNGPDCLY